MILKILQACVITVTFVTEVFLLRVFTTSRVTFTININDLVPSIQADGSYWLLSYLNTKYYKSIPHPLIWGIQNVYFCYVFDTNLTCDDFAILLNRQYQRSSNEDNP